MCTFEKEMCQTDLMCVMLSPVANFAGGVKYLSEVKFATTAANLMAAWGRTIGCTNAPLNSAENVVVLQISITHGSIR